MTVWFKKGLNLFLFASLLLLSSCQNDPRTPNDTTSPEPIGWFAGSNLSKGVFFTAAADPSDPNIIYAGSSAIGVYRTNNGGATWTAANRGLPLQPTRSLFVDPNNPKNIYAGTAGGGVFVSVDSGETWQPISAGLSNLDVYAVAYNPHAAPTGLQVTSSDKANTLHWNAVPNAASYEISFCTTNCETTFPSDPANWSPISRASADILKRDHTHTGLTTGTAYYYVVRAIVSGMNSPFSSKVSSVPRENANPNLLSPYPNSVSLTVGNRFNALQWSATSAGATYNVYKKDSPGVAITNTKLTLTPISTPSFTDTSVVNGQIAYYIVTAIKEGAESAPSAEVSAVPHSMTALFAATGGGGVFASGPAGEFRSTVNGAALDTTDALDVSSLLIDPATRTADFPTLYAGTRAGVYKTLDAGKSWTLVGGSLPAVLSLVLDGQKLYAGTASGIYQGATSGNLPWTLLGGANQAITSISIDPSDAQTLYATSATAGILKSIDGGASWAASNQGLTLLDLRSILVHPRDRNLLYAGGVGALFKSIDGGGQWTPIDLGTLDNVSNPLPTAAVNTLAAAPGVGSLLYAGGDAGIFKSADQGKGWAMMNTQLGSKTVLALEVHPVQPGTLYAALIDQGIYKSLDGGGSWRLENGLSPTAIPATVTDLIIDPAQSSQFYAGTAGSGVYRGIEEANGHFSWSPANAGMETSRVISLAAIPGILASDATTVYAGTFQNGIFKCAFKLLETCDGGWQEIGGTLSDKSVLTLAVHPERADTLFAGISAGLYRSGDGGLNWAPVTGLQGVEVLTVSFDPAASPPLIYAGTSSGVFKSSDDGGRWTLMSDGNPPFSVSSILTDPQQPTIVYAGTLSTGLFKRTK